MHIGSLAIYDQRTAPGGQVTFKDILQFFKKRLHKARAFRQRVARVPLSLDHPYWIEDPDFDLEFHVRHIALPNPGDWRQLCIQAARLHARPLDRSKPLWEAYVIEGLDNVAGVPKGSFALLTKIHHAAIDADRRLRCKDQRRARGDDQHRERVGGDRRKGQTSLLKRVRDVSGGARSPRRRRPPLPIPGRRRWL